MHFTDASYATSASLVEQGTGEIRTFQIPTNHSGPNAIVSAPNDTFWFVEFTGGKLGEFFSQNDSFKEFPIPETGAVPASLAIDGRGNIWFSDQSGEGSIWMFDPQFDHFTKYNTLTKGSTPLFILPDDSDDIWFTETTTNRIGELVYPNYSMIEYSLPSANSGPVEMAWGQNQTHLWITETFTGKIACFDVRTQSFLEYSPPASLSLKYPVGIVTDSSGNVWVSEHGGSAVIELTPSNSTFKSFPTSIPASSSYPISAVATLAIDPQGTLWFVEHYANKVGRLDPATGQMEEFQIPSTEPAYSVLNALDSQGNFWFTEFSTNSIAEIPANASSSVSAVLQLTGGQNSTESGKVLQANVFVKNSLSVPQTVSLSATSSFSATGFTPSQQILLNTTSVYLPANGDAVVGAQITPGTSLPTGIYSIGIVATASNTSTIGIAFISVRSQSSLIGWIISDYPIVIISVAAALALSYAALSMRSKPGWKKEVTRN